MIAMLAGVSLALGATGATGAGGATSAGGPEIERPNPCIGELAAFLLCPDLLMAAPYGMYVTRGGGKVLLHATNNIKSRGEGPLEVRGRRTGRRKMAVKQVIHTIDGGKLLFETDGELVFFNVPKQGPFWKFHEAARFELWSLGAAGERVRMVRTGPKLNYCYRDLKRTAPSPRSPRKRVYPACSQDPRKRGRTLGTSVGWSDIYPAKYHQNWINVRGLRGCFEFVHRFDPDDYVFENNEANNEGSRRIRLPPKGRTVRGC